MNSDADQQQEAAFVELTRLLAAAIRSDANARELRRTVLANLSTVLRAAGDDKVAEALGEAGWDVYVTEDGDDTTREQIVARSEWRPVTPEEDA